MEYYPAYSMIGEKKGACTEALLALFFFPLMFSNRLLQVYFLYTTPLPLLFHF